jgi:hypothetical protein
MAMFLQFHEQLPVQDWNFPLSGLKYQRPDVIPTAGRKRLQDQLDFSQVMHS